MVSEPPLILAFDTSAAHCAAALVRGGDVLTRRDEPMARGQAERLMPMLEEMLAESGLGWAALDGIGVCTGPGNFTGLRLAVAAARGLAMGLGVPAVGVSLFEALAVAHGGPVLVVLPDKRAGSFAQAFSAGAPTGAPTAGDLAILQPFETGTVCIGHEAAALAARLGIEAGPEAVRADMVVLGRIAARRLADAAPPAPLYLRPADAMPPSEAPPRILG